MSSLTTTAGRARAAGRPKRRARRPPAVAVWLLVLGILLLPLLLSVGKMHSLPTSEVLTKHASLAHVDPALRSRVTDILFVPLGALVVVVFRLLLGLRVLGPFRSVLLAFAFLATGITVGLGFLAATVAALLVVRPVVNAVRLPYFGRISIMLSVVAVAVALGVIVGSWVSYRPLEEVAYLPVVVVCLVGEGLARTVRKEGMRSGLWRAAVTALAAVIVAGLASLAPLRNRLILDPELVFVAIALIVVVSRFMDFRLLAGLNPKARDRGSARDDPDPLGDEEVEA
ncbi:MAG TPA: 7TM domain-containing protein [Miltoncostaeaceae bacterium]|nr:7TM domain-containing protein [Miltoncostaeaceae bacterium]